MIFQTMPKSQYVKSFGIVVSLAIIGCVLWRNEWIVSGTSIVASSATASSSSDKSLHDNRGHASSRRATRGTNAESRVRSLLQIAPGEVGNIRIPSSGISLIVTEELEKKYGDILLIPLTQEQAIHGLEEILRKGDSLGSRVDIANGKISWKGEGIIVDGEVKEEGPARRLHLTTDVTSPKTMYHEVIMKIEDHTFFMVRSPGANADGVLLVFGESSEKLKPAE